MDIVVYGHSHKSDIHEKNGIIYINPGSVGPKRFKLPISMAKLTIVEDKQEYECSNTKNICNIKDYRVEIITINS
ncbi:metallophosphoesterase family protein [Romboutsia sp.]|uniref:metallophosphoesterase family protein n=1 Tax=Romboutsia sp. TaxID=1965302 RepID=UPI003F395559